VDIQTIIKQAAAKAAELAAKKAASGSERTYLKHSTEGLVTIVNLGITPTKNDGPIFTMDLRVDTSVPNMPDAKPDEVGAIRQNPIFLDKFDGEGYNQMIRIVNTALDNSGEPVNQAEFEAALNDIKSKEQPLRGVQLKYEVSPLKKSRKGNFYSVASFSTVKNQNAATVAANRKTVDELLAKAK
jgi:hypothetical protein